MQEPALVLAQEINAGPFAELRGLPLVQVSSLPQRGQNHIVPWR